MKLQKLQIVQWTVGCLFLSLILVIGCDKKDPAPGAQEAQAEQALETTKEETEELPSMAELPVVEDFMQEAEASIGDQNYRDELKRLAQELEGDN